ncbi:MAG: hypothetical protein JNM84_19300, partial [Planctomycetes bacterium]|nr:hypothetical protein [Planctomycetota bacterium]
TFGESCGGITQTISGSARAGGTITTACAGLGSFGSSTLMIGFSETSFQGLPIPMDLNVLLGTTGCLLLAGPEITLPLRANRFGVATTDLPIPGLTEGLIVRLQHVSFGVPGGGIAFSNGAEVRVEL